MRLKIRGEITPEHLAEAFAAAMKKLESLVPGAKFYGADLYLRPYFADGLPFDIMDNGKSLIMNIPAPPGTLVKPALSAEAQQRQDEAREAQRQREAEAAERDRKEVAEHNREQQIRAVQRVKARTAFDALNELTSKILASEPQRMVDGFNEAIRASWHSLAPKEPHGPRKGELKPLPEFSIVDGKLSLFAASWKNPRILLNPIGTLNLNLIAPVWTHDAWLVAIASFLKIMRDMGGTMPEEIFGDHLPKGGAAD